MKETRLVILTLPVHWSSQALERHLSLSFYGSLRTIFLVRDGTANLVLITGAAYVSVAGGGRSHVSSG